MSATTHRVPRRVLLRYVLIALAVACVVLAHAALQQPGVAATSGVARDAQSTDAP